MRPVNKWAVRPTVPETIPWIMQRAFSLAVNGKPGAVFIDIPSDLGLVEADMPAYRPALGRLRSRAAEADLKAAARLLTAAKRPAMVCGSGAVAAGAARPVAALVGDAALTLAELKAGLRGIDRPAARRRLATIGRAKARHQKLVSAEGAGRSVALRTPQILHALNRIFGRDTIMVHENGGADLWSYYL